MGMSNHLSLFCNLKTNISRNKRRVLEHMAGICYDESAIPVAKQIFKNAYPPEYDFFKCFSNDLVNNNITLQPVALVSIPIINSERLIIHMEIVTAPAAIERLIYWLAPMIEYGKGPNEFIGYIIADEDDLPKLIFLNVEESRLDIVTIRRSEYLPKSIDFGIDNEIE